MKDHLVICLLLACTSISSHAEVLMQEADLQDWSGLTITGATQYDRVMDLEQGVVLRAESHASASGYEYRNRVDLKKTPVLTWQWSVESFPHFSRVNDSGIEGTVTEFDEQSKSGDDYAVRVSVGRYSFFGAKVIHYVWSSQQKSGAAWKSASNPDSVILAVSGKETPAQRWQTVRRNIRQDWQKAFGEKIDRIDFVSIMTDTDDTQGKAVAYYGDMAFVAQ
ncbi:MAG: DUF3047 domain-containing protein [Oceanospirillaceae bacterium]|nr:DUF3047 domain-containing protein [Oceanospirillaceae bacterium]MCP5335229.1 DUF3047 domain-containing protein [Oceanospirillaceae bacterium]